MKTENLTQKLAVVAQIAASSAVRAAGSFFSDVVNTSIYDRLVAYTGITQLDGAATLLVKAQHCSASGGTFVDINVTSAATSTFTNAANGSIAELEIRLDQNPATSQFLRFCATAAVSTATFYTLVIGAPNYAPGKDVDLASVTQITVY